MIPIFSLRPLRVLTRITTFLLLPILLLTLFAHAGITLKIPENRPVSTPKAAPVVILDPGHGGRDCGAISPSGDLEKDLNLTLSLALRDILLACGVTVVMTRQTDIMLDAGTATTHKMNDFLARLNMISEYPTAIFVSIHMNKFPDAACHGTQIWYGSDKDSAAFAASVMTSILRLQPENHRKTKPAGSSIFLLDRSPIPSILVECGFLSSPIDLALLTDPSSQIDLAAAIGSGILTYLSASDPA